jgi:hypothetical protein
MLLSKHGKAFSQTKHSMHILVACVFSKEIWFCVLSLVGLHQCTLEASDGVFQEWWRAAESKVLKQYHLGLWCCGVA